MPTNDTLDFGTWKLEFQLPRATTEYAGFNLNIDNGYWFFSPPFIAQLKEPTFRYLLEAYTKLEKVLDTPVKKDECHGFRSFAILADRWTRHIENKDTQVYREPRVKSSAGYDQTFSLFTSTTPVEEPAIKTFSYGGLNNWTHGETQGSIYSSLIPQAGLASGSGPGLRSYDSDIRSYNYVPDNVTFMSSKKEKTKLYFGLELEVNTMIPWYEVQYVMTNVEPKQEPFIYAMSDSSISGQHTYNYEMVTVPMTPRRMKKEYRVLFGKLEKLAGGQGKKLTDLFDMSAATNGIHIHTSAVAFKDAQRRRFTALWNSDIPAVLKTVNLLAGRNLKTTRYCKPSPAYEGRRLGYCLKETRYHDKYVACKDEGRGANTVEVRVFKGIPSLKNVLGCIDTVEAMFFFTLEMPISAFGREFPKVFHTWLYSQPNYKYANLKERLECA